MNGATGALAIVPTQNSPQHWLILRVDFRWLHVRVEIICCQMCCVVQANFSDAASAVACATPSIHYTLSNLILHISSKGVCRVIDPHKHVLDQCSVQRADESDVALVCTKCWDGSCNRLKQLDKTLYCVPELHVRCKLPESSTIHLILELVE